MSPARINLTGHFLDVGGWGRHSRSFAAALERHAEVAACGLSAEEWARWPRQETPAPRRREPLAGAAGIAIAQAGFRPQVLGRPRIVHLAWDTSRVPEPLRASLDGTDRLWAPTEWGRRIFAAAGFAEERLGVVPEGVDAELFVPRPASVPRSDSLFRFLTVGKWETRKGMADLVRTFCREFSDHDEVELVLHAHNPYIRGFDLQQAIERETRAARAHRPRIRASPPVTLEGLIGLMQQSDAFVLPTRAEGWGLPILEAMSCGLPVIVTDYSGLRGYANAGNSYLIAVERMIPAHDPLHLDPSWDWGEWAQPDLDHLRHLLRHVFEHRDEADAVGRRARNDARLHGWDRAARRAIDELGGGELSGG